MADDQADSPPERWRLRIGAIVLITGFLAPAAIPLVTASSLPVTWKTVISGALAIGVPEVMMVAAVAIMGKPGFQRLKQMLGRFMQQHGPPQHVGPARHRIGLVLFVLPLLFGWLGVYVRHFVPDFDAPLYVFLAGDVMFVSSFFVLGGEFWDKTRALFLREARVVLPDRRV